MLPLPNSLMWAFKIFVTLTCVVFWINLIAGRKK